MTHGIKKQTDLALTGTAEEGIFGVDTKLDTASLIYIPVPWEVTTSYGQGASLGPDAILQASPQLDLYLKELPNHYTRGFHLMAPSNEIFQLNEKYKPLAKMVQSCLEKQRSLDGKPELEEIRQAINTASRQVNALVYQQCRVLDEQGKFFALIGGDHSSPYGQIRYLCEKYQGNVGVLQIDAHLDLRDSYQGFVFSHASIMRNIMTLDTPPSILVQVGVRDFSEEEVTFAEADPRMVVFYDEDMKTQLYQGKAYADIVAKILDALPENVYISFDVDGLKPDLCPHTGTPVAGGLEFEQVQFLIKYLVRSGRRIIGFDLCEVCPNIHDSKDQWDGNVGARLLLLLSSWMMESVALE